MKHLSAAVLLLTAAFSVLLGGGFPPLPAQEAAGEIQPADEPVTEVHAQVIRSEAHDEIEDMIGKPLPITIGPDGLPSGPEEFNRARDEIVNRTEPLTYDEYFEIIGKCELKWAEPTLWNLMKERQNPPISIDELKALYERKRDSIKTFYTVFRDGDKRVTFASKGPDLLYLKNEEKAADDTGAESGDRVTINARNKSDFRHLFLSSGKNGKEYSIADLMPLSDSGYIEVQCYNQNNPLAISKIAGPGIISRDMVKYMEERKDLCLLEKPEIIDGHRCFVLADRDSKIYLDADRDYSVYAVFHHYRLEKLEGWPGYISRHTSEPTGKTILHGLKDYGGGVWLPRRAEIVSYAEDGSVESEEEIVYDKIKVNRRIRDKFFEDIIPPDARVGDNFQHTSYLWRDRNMLDIPEKDRPAVRNQRVYRSIVVAIGLALIAAGAFAKWRKRRPAGG